MIRTGDVSRRARGPRFQVVRDRHGDTVLPALARTVLTVAVVVGVLGGLGCGGDRSPGPGDETGVMELRRALPTGETADWYAERLEELGYETTSVEYDDATHDYRLHRADRRFRVRLGVDPETERVVRVRIEETQGEPPTRVTADASGRADPDANAAGEAGEERGAAGTRAAGGPESRDDELQRDAPPVPAPEPAGPRPRALATLPAGTRIPARLHDRLDSGSVARGDAFTMTVTQPVRAGREVVIPAGSVIHGVVAEAVSAAGPAGRGRLLLEIRSVDVDPVSFELDGVIAAPGARVDGSQGGGTLLASGGEEVTLPADTQLEVVLRSDARVGIY